MAFVGNGVKKSAEHYKFRKYCINATRPFYVQIFQKAFNFTFIDRLEGKSFTIRNIESIDYLFNNAWMIFVRIDNISYRMYASVFKVCAKDFWFIATALSNNIYVINY